MEAGRRTESLSDHEPSASCQGQRKRAGLGFKLPFKGPSLNNLRRPINLPALCRAIILFCVDMPCTLWTPHPAAPFHATAYTHSIGKQAQATFEGLWMFFTLARPASTGEWRGYPRTRRAYWTKPEIHLDFWSVLVFLSSECNR